MGGRIAYFSMEVALEPRVPTYAGGLGVLAGDTLRSAADLGLPVVGVTLLHREGYFRQSLDASGRQGETPSHWDPAQFMEQLPARAEVGLGGRSVRLAAWRYLVHGAGGSELPVYLLDADLPENAEPDRRLTGRLYGGDERYRLAQEALLGIGGVRMLRALGHDGIERFHLNEGHAALAVLALLEEKESLEAIREHCVFTTHTPVPAGHDRFEMPLVVELLGPDASARLARLGQTERLNMTDLALRSSRFVNGVAMRHGEVSRGMFPHYPIASITNGVHPATWAAPPLRKLFDHHVPEWRRDAFTLRNAVGIPLREIRVAHAQAKQALLERIEHETGERFEPGVLTLGFARRATAYKRPALLFEDLDRLRGLVERAGPLQLVFAGKAHPKDHEGKWLIEEVFRAKHALDGQVRVAWLANYGMQLGRLLCSGSDVWLNTPVPPLEASGTSGMKAALNGVPSLSVLDGWWVEGCVEGVTGWAIGHDGERDGHAASLYEKLEHAVMPRFYSEPERFLDMRRAAIAINASFFNTQRMVLQYLHDAYTRGS